MTLQTEFRNAMAQLGSAVSVITTDGPAGKFGFTASAVCSVTDQPPTLLVCMNRNSWAHAHFKQNGVLCVNVLSSLHFRYIIMYIAGLSCHFATEYVNTLFLH
jgi:flavin reductase